MSDMSGLGLPKSRPIAPKRRKPPTPYTAQRLRFGILAARHMLERWRMADWQHDDLDGCKGSGWLIKDSQDAFDAEYASASERLLNIRSLAAVRARDRKAARKWRRLR